MKRITSTGIASLLALGVLGAASSTHGQLPVSRQAAIIPVSVTGAGTVTPVSIPFTQEPAARDIVGSVSGQDITSAGGGYTAGAFASGHVLIIVTGPNRGTALPITANSTTTFTVTGAIPSLTNGSDEFEIVPLATIGSVFGDTTSGGPLDLTGASSASGADLVIIGSSQYFYKTSGANAPGWKLTSAPNGAGDLGLTTAISNLRGVSVLRRGAATTVKVRGIARGTRAVMDVPTGTTLLSWPFPASVSLLASGLQTSIQGASSASGADKVVISNLQYFYKTSGAASPGWKLTTNPNEALPGQNNTVLNPGGKAFYIIRAGAPTTHGVLESFN